MCEANAGGRGWFGCERGAAVDEQELPRRDWSSEKRFEVLPKHTSQQGRKTRICWRSVWYAHYRALISPQTTPCTRASNGSVQKDWASQWCLRFLPIPIMASVSHVILSSQSFSPRLPMPLLPSHS